MLAISEIIDFLLGLMRDEDAARRSSRTRRASLERAGLEGVTGQDVRDARLLMADTGLGAGSGGEPGRVPLGRRRPGRTRSTTPHSTTTWRRTPRTPAALR